jgi:hypothetical protein
MGFRHDQLLKIKAHFHSRWRQLKIGMTNYYENIGDNTISTIPAKLAPYENRGRESSKGDMGCFCCY